MEEYRGKYRRTSAKSKYVGGGKSARRGFLAGLFRQTLWSAAILAAAVAVSSSANPAAQSAAKYVKSAITYKPDIEWAVDGISAFFGKSGQNADENAQNEQNEQDETQAVSTEDENAGSFE